MFPQIMLKLGINSRANLKENGIYPQLYISGRSNNDLACLFFECSLQLHWKVAMTKFYSPSS